MAIPAHVRLQAETALAEFCATHSSIPGADRLRYAYAIEPSAALLLVQRPGFVNQDQWISTPVAKFRYSEARDEWSLYWSDENKKWQRVSNVKPAKDVRVLLQTVVTDPTGVFWS